MRTGRCQCGGVQFECPNEPIELYLCHCRECQRQSSSAFGMSFIVRWEQLALTSGEPKYWSRRTESGGNLDCAFCPVCGSRLWHRLNTAGDTVSIKAGTLDEPVRIDEATHIWTSRKLTGLVLPDGAVTFPHEPVIP